MTCPSCGAPLPEPGALPLDYARAVAERVLRSPLGRAILAKARKGRKGRA